MFGAFGLKNATGWRKLCRLGFVAGGVTAAAVGLYCCRGPTHRAGAQPARPTASIPSPVAETSDYASRVVAYVYQNQAITRQELGDYLIARHGADKLPVLLNKRIVDEACRRRGITVTAAEVDAALAEDLKGLAVDQATFIKTVLARAKKNLHEWKEDVLRPRLQMSRLVHDRVTLSDADLHKAYESAYGEKVECRLILWPAEQQAAAHQEYAQLRDSETAFAERAKKQPDPNSPLSASGGKIKPISRHSMGAELEQEAFKLRPGQVSPLIRTPQGIVLLKCDRRIPADTTVSFTAARPRLIAEMREHKLQEVMGQAFHALREEARPQPLLKKAERLDPGAPGQVVAYLFDNHKVTREELGEFLIARYGAEKLDFLVNRRIIDAVCAQRGISVSDADVDQALRQDLEPLKCDQKVFEKEWLGRWGKSLFEWREDVIRPRLLLTKLCAGRVKCTDEDLKKGFEAYHGEKLECRLILWPPDQAKYALQAYAKVRDSEAEFDKAAKSQASPTLAARGGRIDPFGKHMLGDDNLEREAFKLHPGEVSTLIGTPQGQVVIKCDRRIPPVAGVSLDQVRDRLTKEIIEKKTQSEMMVVFKEMRDKAAPRLLIQPANQPEDLAAQAKHLLGSTQAPK